MENYDALIIEDSPAICLRLKEFAQKLGFNNVHIAKTGSDGIGIFREYLDKGKTPIVFLDYNLPDMDGLSVIMQILDVRPETRVILQTAREKTDDKVKEVISYGAYRYLAKPFGFDEVKGIMDAIKKEDTQLGRMDDMEIIRMFLKTHSRVSMAMITDHTGKQKSEIVPVLEDLERSGSIVRAGSFKEISCEKCGTVRVKQFFHCPSCYSFNFKKESVIEHYKCGNISPVRTYKNEQCPNCHEMIKVIGVDYRTLENFYTCNDCGDKFPELHWNFRCLQCSNQFDIEHANWRESAGYKVITI